MLLLRAEVLQGCVTMLRLQRLLLLLLRPRCGQPPLPLRGLLQVLEMRGHGRLWKRLLLLSRAPLGLLCRGRLHRRRGSRERLLPELH